MCKASYFRRFIYAVAMVAGCVLLLSAAQAWAVEIDEVVSTSPSWNTFTNKDGTGLYHEILRKVFALYDLPVRHVYSTSGRSEALLINHQADIMTCDDKPTPPLVMGRYPLYVNDFYVFYKNDRIGEWKGDESLRGREVLCQPTYYAAENFDVPVTIREIQTGPQAVAMILFERSDFYVDDLTLIQQSLAENPVPYDDDECSIKKVGRRAYFPLFNPTERGRAIMELFADGMLRLHEQGQLKPIYDRWGYLYPDFKAY